MAPQVHYSTGIERPCSWFALKQDRRSPLLSIIWKNPNRSDHTRVGLVKSFFKDSETGQIRVIYRTESQAYGAQVLYEIVANVRAPFDAA